MAEPQSPTSPEEPAPAQGIPEIRIRKGSDAPSIGDTKSTSSAPLASFEVLSDVEDHDDDGGGENDVFAPEPYTQGYGQLVDSDAPFGVNLNLPGVHELPAAVDDDDEDVTMEEGQSGTDPTPTTPPEQWQRNEESMEVDDEENGDRDAEEEGGGTGYEVFEDQSVDQGPEEGATEAANGSGVATSVCSASGQASSMPVLDLDFDMFETPQMDQKPAETGAASFSPGMEVTDGTEFSEAKKVPPLRPKSPSTLPRSTSPTAPPRPVSPAGFGKPPVSPARPKSPPRSRSPARPKSPIARSKSPVRPPPPKSPQPSGGGGGDNKRAAPRRPPPPGAKKDTSPLQAEFDQDESELVEIHAQSSETRDSPLSPNVPEGDLLSPESVGDQSDGSSSRANLETTARDRPRSATPINMASFQDIVASADANSEKTEDVEKIKITLPKYEFKNRSKSPRKVAKDQAGSWETFGQVQKQLSHGSDEDGEKKEKPKRPGPPGPSRPPPPSAASIHKAASVKKTWETFDGPPSKDGEFGSFDADTTSAFPTGKTVRELSKEATESKEKKSKFKSPKKLMGLGKHQKAHKSKKYRDDDLQRFIKETDDEKPEEKSKEMLAFEEMHARIQESVATTQGNLSTLGKKMDKTIAHIEATNSPWTVMLGEADGTQKPLEPTASIEADEDIADPKSGWQGFDDSFSVTPNNESGKNMPALSVIPIPSPKHPPVPPNNSRRNSGDEKNNSSREGDLLGLSLETGSEDTNKKESSLNYDLLGLMGETPLPSGVAGEGSGRTGGSGGMVGDMLGLSRNPVESSVSSGVSSHIPGDDIFALVNNGTTNAGDDMHTRSDLFIDEFLGISSEKEKETGTLDSTVETKADEMQVDDDPFGLGMATKKESLPADSVGTIDLMMGAPMTDDDDPFKLPPEVDAIAAGEKITEADEVEPDTTGDDFLNMAAAAAKEVAEEKDKFETDDFQFGIVPERKIEIITTESKKSGKSVVIKAVARPRPKTQVQLATFIPPPPPKQEIQEQNELLMLSPDSDDFDPRSEFDAEVRPMPDNSDSIWITSLPIKGENPFEADLKAKEGVVVSSSNPFATPLESTPSTNPFTTDEEKEEKVEEQMETEPTDDDVPYADDGFDIFEKPGKTEPTSDVFNPFATIVPDDEAHAPGDDFDPFATIQGDDAFVDIKKDGEGEKTEDEDVTSPRFNPFNKEAPADEKFAGFEPEVKKEGEGEEATDQEEPPLFAAFTSASESSADEVEEILEPLPPFREPFIGDGWNLLLRQPTKKKLAGNRYWKTVYVRLVTHRDMPVIRVFNNDKNPEIFHELPLQPCYQMCDMGLQQFDQYGKCHTVKIQYVFYRERVGVKADRIAPTLGDLARVRDLKGLKDLVHKPKATMILDHAPQASELLKFGSLNYDEFRSFVWTLEDAFFHLTAQRERKSQNYTKDEITIDIVDEYYLDLDHSCHILFHKARIRVFCLAFLTGNPTVELGINDRRRKGREIVGRRDIIPIKTDEWIRIESPVFQCSVEQEEYEKTKVIKFRPLDACQFELMRFRTRPRKNKELPLQIRAQQSVVGKHVEIRADVVIPGYYSNSRKAAQTPCEDISIIFPIPEQWIYMFRVEKRFRYGSVKASTRKPGKIKGLERLTMMAQGMLPPSLIEVSTGSAKYENVFHGIVWRIARLPERNEGAYKQHFFKMRVNLGPHDVMPEDFEKIVKVEFQMPNSTVSRAQARSISVSDVDDPPDRWVHHLAKYEYTVEIEFVEQTRTAAPEPVSSIEEPKSPDSPDSDAPPETEQGPEPAEEQDSTSSSEEDD